MALPLAAWIERRPCAAFAAFAALHAVVWTALPTLLYKNLPLDLIEALTYGREWQYSRSCGNSFRTNHQVGG